MLFGVVGLVFMGLVVVVDKSLWLNQGRCLIFSYPFFMKKKCRENLKLFCKAFLYRIQYNCKQKTVECLSFSLFLSNRKFRQEFCRCYDLFPVLRNKSATKFMNTINYKKEENPGLIVLLKKSKILDLQRYPLNL